jgi:hypothetical protein
MKLIFTCTPWVTTLESKFSARHESLHTNRAPRHTNNTSTRPYACLEAALGPLCVGAALEIDVSCERD